MKAKDICNYKVMLHLGDQAIHLPTESSTEYLPVVRNLLKTDTEYRGHEYLVF
jgi:hypothetical protein